MAESNTPKSVGLVIATHGDLALALVAAGQRILGHKPRLRTAVFAEDGDPPRFSRELQAQVRRANQGAGVIILVDLFGGTPGTVALSLAEPERVDVITGVNLPMVLAADGLPKGLPLAEAARRIHAAGRDAIRSAAETLAGP